MVRTKRGGKGEGKERGGGSRHGAKVVVLPSKIPVPVDGLGPSPVALAAVPESELHVDYSKIEFLMRGVRFGRDGRMYMDDHYHRDEFYNISVVKNHDGEFKLVAKPWCMSQLSCLGSSSMIHVESRLYNISRQLFIDDISKVPQSLPLPASAHPGETFPCHTGISWIDVKDPKKWNPGTPHKFYRSNAEFAALGKTIYGLQSGFVSVPYCYGTRNDMWVQSHSKPPREILKCLVTKRMISQPSKNRILVHLATSPLLGYSVSYLYSWTPEPQDSWELITQEIGARLWVEGHPNLVDDFIYFYKPMCPPFFSAYDLTTKKWVTVNWSANFPPDAAGYKADSMFYLGNRLLCLANCRPDPPCHISRIWGIRVTFSLFRFHTTSTPVDGPLVIFTHLFTNSLTCPGFREVANFISLENQSSMEGKVTTNNKGKKPQFRWNTLMSRALLQVLAEEVRKGNRPNNTFRASSFDLAAKCISEKFNIKCTPENVDNHLKTVRGAWSIISMVRENSGFGWDENLKMITAPPDVYDDYIEKHPQREKYLNKKIEMYEEMSIVVGKDIVRGNFAKSFSDIEVDLAPKPNKIGDKIDTSSSENETSSQPRQHRKRSRVDDENIEIQLITSQLGEVASALHKLACQKLDVNKLYDEIMKIEGFDDVFLAQAFDHLVEHKQLAKAFLAKNDRLRQIWLENFRKKY